MALIWAILGKIDVVAVAGGKIIPSSKVKTLQAMEIGSVKAVHIANGQRVEEGQVLVKLDPTMATAEQSQARQNLLTARIVQARTTVLLNHIDGKPAELIPPEGTPELTLAVERQFVRASIAEYEAQAAALRQQIAQRAAEITSAEAEVTKLRRTLPLIEPAISGPSPARRAGQLRQAEAARI